DQHQIRGPRHRSNSGMTRTKIALFGGTFNPVHTGHLLIAEAALERYGLKQVLFVPAGIPPHKKRPATSARHRQAMLRLATRGNPAFGVSDWEVRQNRKVYTYETLEHFRKQWPGKKLFFLLGSDSMKKLSTWREPRRLQSLCRFIPYERI